MDRQKHPKKKNQLNSYARFSGIAFQMMVIIGLGCWGGVKLDESYPNDYHAFMLIGSLGGIGMAMYWVIKKVARVSNEENTTNEEGN